MPRLTSLFNNLFSRPVKSLLLITLPLLFSACAQFSIYSGNPEQKISQLLKENEYSKIEAILHSLDKDDPQYTALMQRKKKIEKKKHEYIKQQIAKARKLEAENKWQLAIETFDRALEKIADDKALINARAALIKERNFQVNELRKDLLFQRANVLIGYQPLYEKLKALVPYDELARQEISAYEAEKEHLAEQLMGCGRHGVSIQDYALAERCLKLSNQLEPANTKKLLLDEVSHKKNIIRKNQQINLLMAKYKSYYEANDLSAARESLRGILKIDKKNAQANKLIKRLQLEINAKIEAGLKKGKELYSKGKIKQALQVWKSLKSIAGKNEELDRLISRARKVDKNLKELKKQH